VAQGIGLEFKPQYHKKKKKERKKWKQELDSSLCAGNSLAGQTYDMT
jgi:hypothetical protein